MRIGGYRQCPACGAGSMFGSLCSPCHLKSSEWWREQRAERGGTETAPVVALICAEVGHQDAAARHWEPVLKRCLGARLVKTIRVPAYPPDEIFSSRPRWREVEVWDIARAAVLGTGGPGHEALELCESGAAQCIEITRYRDDPRGFILNTNFEEVACPQYASTLLTAQDIRFVRRLLPVAPKTIRRPRMP